MSNLKVRKLSQKLFLIKISTGYRVNKSSPNLRKHRTNGLRTIGPQYLYVKMEKFLDNINLDHKPLSKT